MKKFKIKAETTEVHEITIEVEAVDKVAAEKYVLDGEFEQDEIDDLYQDTTQTKILSTEEVS